MTDEINAYWHPDGTGIDEVFAERDALRVEVERLRGDLAEMTRRRDEWKSRAANHVGIVNALKSATAGQDSRTLSKALLGAAKMQAEEEAARYLTALQQIAAAGPMTTDDWRWKVAQDAVRGQGGWLPIESAPKDGQWMLCACNWWHGSEDWARILRWDNRSTMFPWAEMTAEGVAFGGNIAAHVVTHWMPLPSPPSAQTAPAHVNETPKSEHDREDVLTEAAADFPEIPDTPEQRAYRKGWDDAMEQANGGFMHLCEAAYIGVPPDKPLYWRLREVQSPDLAVSDDDVSEIGGVPV